MKHDLELKLQAWLDGELPEREARRMGQWIARDPAAGALAAELRQVKQALPGNETAKAVPDTRQFYWSQIERRIQREAQRPRGSLAVVRALARIPASAHRRGGRGLCAGGDGASGGPHFRRDFRHR